MGLFLCAIFLTQVIGHSDAFKGVIIAGASREKMFGTVVRSMYSLFELLTLEAWNDSARSIIGVEPAFIIFYLLFMMVFTFGLLNMVVGRVVELTLEHTGKNEQKLLTKKKQETIETLQKLQVFFEEANPDSHGLSFSKFEEYTKLPSADVAIEGSEENIKRKKMLEVVKACRLPTHEVPYLFEHLDTDSNGSVSVHEFLMGTLRFHGSFENIDFAGSHLLLEASERTIRRIGNLVNRLEKDDRRFMKKIELGIRELASVAR